MDKIKLNKTDIIESLRSVKDPELEINIVDMGLIYGIAVQADQILIDMTLSSKGCPMGAGIVDSVRNCLGALYPSLAVEVRLVWEPAWTIGLINEEGRAFLEM